ncbi:DUF4118 domain-containing protein [Terriglobus albidus]|uniref:histidine kinase n=1 Tax=Terriglobus albidus TaxID=1592106 RepID=A0A5B9ED73_9BACT|nr:ATP-binding protein [Terriglobus albidus]QEE28287.1 DUF4118 domain-containing protein [Terriglobus albidus]
MKALRSRSVLWTAATCGAVGLFGFVFGDRLQLAFACVIYLLLTIIVAWQARFRAAVVTAVYATLCLDYFFTEPKRTLRLVSIADFASVTAFASVALLVSHLSNRVRQQAEDLVLQRERQRALHELSAAALLLDWREAYGEHLAWLVERTLNTEGVSIWTAREERTWVAGNIDIPADSLRATFMAGKEYDLTRNGVAIRLLKSGTRNIGVLCIRSQQVDALTVDSVASIISSSLERVRALRSEVTAQSERLSEQLRTSVLDGLAHAFKTPLTTISVASAGLAEVANLPEEQRGELLALIRKEADRLNLITEQVLRTARLEWDKVLTLTCVNLGVLLEETISVLGEQAAGKIEVVQQTPRMTIEADRAVLKIAFEQILENALKYGDPGARVTVSIAVRESAAMISIHNHGSYISPEEQQLVFTKFYRSPTVVHRASGTGIGLSVAQHAVVAHGGTITIKSDEGEGTTFVITLPIQEGEGES